MNRKLTVFANTLEGAATVLLLFSALRADGGLSFWLPIALFSIGIGGMGLCLSWLCSEAGRAFRRHTFGTPVSAVPPHAPAIIPFPKAG